MAVMVQMHNENILYCCFDSHPHPIPHREVQASFYSYILDTAVKASNAIAIDSSFLFLRDLLSNRIRLWRHNYTILPRSLEKMWVSCRTVIVEVDNYISNLSGNWVMKPSFFRLHKTINCIITTTLIHNFVSFAHFIHNISPFFKITFKRRIVYPCVIIKTGGPSWSNSQSNNKLFLTWKEE